MTAAAVKEFYTRDGNRYNCHCSQTEALLDADGKPILTPKLRAKMDGEKLKWDAENPQ